MGLCYFGVDPYHKPLAEVNSITENDKGGIIVSATLLVSMEEFRKYITPCEKEKHENDSIL